jgi:hypothetical protein
MINGSKMMFKHVSGRLLKVVFCIHWRTAKKKGKVSVKIIFLSMMKSNYMHGRGDRH